MAGRPTGFRQPLHAISQEPLTFSAISMARMVRRVTMRIGMALKIGTRIARAVTNAIRARDRAEVRAIDTLLAFAESSRPKRRRAKARRRVRAVKRQRRSL